MRWLLAYRGSGISCSLLAIGILYGFYRSYAFPAAFPVQWEGIFWSLEKVVVALLLSAVGHCVLLSVAACSAGARKILSKVTAVLAEIPSLCLLGPVCILFPAFWSVAAIAMFSLLTRSVNATLEAGHDIPAGFLKTARALRLGRWQSFWRLHVPFAFPDLVRSVLQNLPDFWLCIFGGEMIVSLFMPHKALGLGGTFLSAIGGHDPSAAVGLFSLMILLVFLVQHGLIAPLRGYGRRYAVCDLAHSAKNRSSGRYVIWVGISGMILTAILLSYRFWPWPEGALTILGPLGYLAVALFIVGGFWAYVGGLLLGYTGQTRRWIRKVCLTGALLPVPLLFPWLAIHLPQVILPAMAVMGMCGWIVLGYANGPMGQQFVTMGQHLRLPSFSLWKNVRFPLICPVLLQAGAIVLPFFWDGVYMVATLDAEHNAVLLGLLQKHLYGKQLLFLCLMTLLAACVRWGIFIPLQERMAHRYRI